MTYHIALNMDDQYLEHALAMLVSVFHNNPCLHFTVHVITAGLSKASIDGLNELVARQYRNELQIHELSGRNARLFPGYANSHISQAANYRLFVADILPQTIDKVLYLDCDLIVTGDLKTLFDIPLNDNAIAAVEDTWSGKDDNYCRLGYSREYGYFNSGVMMISLSHWREHNLSERFVDFYKSHPNLLFVDQDILNGVLHDKWQHLPLAWNVQDGFLRRKCRVRKEMMSEVVDACKHPLIIHFTGSRKPWNYDCLSPLRYEYFTYVDMTAFRGSRPTTPMRWSCKLAMDRLLFTLHLKKKRYRESLGGKY